MTHEDVIRELGLEPHPEGGFYRETFRDLATLPDGRNASTAIYFLLPAGIRSRWHRVDASEIWLWHAGGPLSLSIAETDASPVRTLAIGPDLRAGQRPQMVIPKHAWQQAEPAENTWSLVSCVVAPGFTFEGFEMAPPAFKPGGSGG